MRLGVAIAFLRSSDDIRTLRGARERAAIGDRALHSLVHKGKRGFWLLHSCLVFLNSRLYCCDRCTPDFILPR